jgi:hypothetical protein
MVKMALDISSKKRARIGRLVVPHLKRSDYFLAAGKPIRAKREVIKAVRALKREGVMPEDLMQVIADNLHSIGVMILDDGGFEKAIAIFAKSLGYKIKFSRNRESILRTKHGLIVAYTFSCHFDLAKNLIEELKEEALKIENGELLKVVEEYDSQLMRIVRNEPLIGVSDARLTITGQERKYPLVNDLYLPKLFNDLEAIIDRIELKPSHDKIACSIEFQIVKKGDLETFKPYEEDPWKNSFSPLWRTIPEGTDNFVVFIDEGMAINEDEVKIQDKDEIRFRLNMRIGDVFIPDSYPRPGVYFRKNRKDHPATNLIPKCKKLMFFRGKWCAFRWKLQLNKKYEIKFPIYASKLNGKFSERDLSSQIGLFFPFKFLTIRKVKVLSQRDLRLLTVSLNLFSYIRTQGPVGAWRFYFDGKNAVPSPPKPYSLNQKTSSKSYELIHLNSKKCLESIHEKPMIAEDYSLLRFQFSYQLPEKMMVTTRTWRDVIPVGIYCSSSSSDEYRIPLAEYYIINNTTSAQKIGLSTQILGFTEEIRDFCTVSAKSALRISHSPRMLPEKLVKIGNGTFCQIRTIASLKLDQTESRLLDEKHETALLPHNIMVWQVINPFTGVVENLSNYIAAWVTPDVREIKQLIKDAAMHDNKIFVGYSATTEEEQDKVVLKQIKAIFNASQSRYQIKYKDETINYGTSRAYFSQPIKLPINTLETRSGNCIELSVLFASALETVGINPVIALMPGHAFIGWETWKDSAKFQFLETTAIENLRFDDAFSIGQEHMLKRKSVSSQGPDEFPGSLIFVQIKKTRNKGIVPIIL